MLCRVRVPRRPFVLSVFLGSCSRSQNTYNKSSSLLPRSVTVCLWLRCSSLHWSCCQVRTKSFLAMQYFRCNREISAGSTSNEGSRQCQMPRPSSIRWFQWPRQARSTWVKLARGDTARTRHTRLHIKQMCFAATGQHGQTAPELRTLVFF